MEAPPGFEPGNKGFADLCLTTWLCRRIMPRQARHFSLARVAGFEPAHDGIRIRCLTAWRYPNITAVLIFYGVGSGIRTHVYRSHNPGS